MVWKRGCTWVDRSLVNEWQHFCSVSATDFWFRKHKLWAFKKFWVSTAFNNIELNFHGQNLLEEDQFEYLCLIFFNYFQASSTATTFLRWPAFPTCPSGWWRMASRSSTAAATTRCCRSRPSGSSATATCASTSRRKWWCISEEAADSFSVVELMKSEPNSLRNCQSISDQR